MKTASVLLLLFGFAAVLVSADKNRPVPSSATLHVSEEHDGPDQVTLVITPSVDKAEANPGKTLSVRIPGPSNGFKPFDEQGHSFLLSADGRTFGCMEKFALLSYRCDCVVLTKEGTIQVYPDINGAIRPFLKSKHMPVADQELVIDEIQSRKVTLGSPRLTIKGEHKYLYLVILLKPEGGVEVARYWLEKAE